MCIIGRNFNQKLKISQRCDNIEKLLTLELSSKSNVTQGASQFIPRDRDPTQKQPDLTKEERDNIINMVFNTVLETPTDFNHPCVDNRLVISKSGNLQTTDGRWWNPGGNITIK